MIPIHELGQATRDDLRAELIQVTTALDGKYSELSITMQDHQREYLKAYVQEPATSVAAKNRAAQYWCEDLTRQIIQQRASINSIVLKRDLIVFLLIDDKPNVVPFPELVTLDSEGLGTI
jgi:hypothetical protein